MAGSNNDKKQNDIVDSAKGFITGSVILFGVFLIALVASIAFPPNHGEEAAGGDTAPVEVNAEEVYTANCMACHGQNLEGAGAPKLIDIGSRMSEDEIADIIKNGKPPGMPGGLVSKPEEVTALAKWLAEMK